MPDVPTTLPEVIQTINEKFRERLEFLMLRVADLRVSKRNETERNFIRNAGSFNEGRIQ